MLRPTSDSNSAENLMLSDGLTSSLKCATLVLVDGAETIGVTAALFCVDSEYDFF